MRNKVTILFLTLFSAAFCFYLFNQVKRDSNTTSVHLPGVPVDFTNIESDADISVNDADDSAGQKDDVSRASALEQGGSEAGQAESISSGNEKHAEADKSAGDDSKKDGKPRTVEDSGVQSVDDRLAIYPLVDEKIEDLGGGLQKRVSLFKKGGRFPFIRREDVFKTDEQGGIQYVSRKVVSADHFILTASSMDERSRVEELLLKGGWVVSHKSDMNPWMLVHIEGDTLDEQEQSGKALQAILPVTLTLSEDVVAWPVMTPNDTSYSSLWGMPKIQANKAWEIADGAGDVIIGVGDTGVQYTHPDLAANMWSNKYEIAGNTIDEDGNSKTNDIYGWDFWDNDSNPSCSLNHGTHVAGTAAAVGFNTNGVIGVAPRAKIVACKICSDDDDTALHSIMTLAREYMQALRTRGEFVAVMNFSYSGGDGSSDQTMCNNNIVPVWSSGNTGTNITDAGYYRVSYTPYVIYVANSTSSDTLATCTLGQLWCDLAAPGSSIYSTITGSSYGYMSGTSMAAPHVSGAAAMVAAANRSLSSFQIMNIINTNVDYVAACNGYTITKGRLNVYKAVMDAKTYPHVYLLSPSDGTTLKRNTEYTLVAGTQITSNTVTAVRFYRDGSTLLGTDSNGSDGWTCSWTPASGTYDLTCEADDSLGRTTKTWWRHRVTVVTSVSGTPGASISATDDFGSEPTNGAKFVVQLSMLSTTNITIPISVSGNASSGADYTDLPSSVVITGGLLYAEIPVTVLDDYIDEPVEALTVTLGTGAGYTNLASTSATAWIHDNESEAPVMVIDDPVSVTTNIGQQAGFSILAGGKTPISYQWQKNSSNISGATSTTYVIVSVLPADEASYRCIVNNSYGSDTSAVATLTVTQPEGATKYWDTSDTAGLQGGNGTWDTGSTVNWNGLPDGTGTRGVWTNWSVASFDSAGGTVSLVGTVLVDSIVFNATNFTLSGGTLTLTGTNGLMEANSDATINSAMGRSGVLTKTGVGRLKLRGTNTCYGLTTISEGILDVTSASLTGSVANASALVFDQSSTGTHSGSISGAGTVQKLSSGTLTLAGNNTFSGSLTLSAGTLTAGSSTAFGSGRFLLNGGTINAPGYTMSNQMTVSGNVGFNGGTFSGAMDLNGTNRTLTVGINTTLSGIISNGGLTKAGASNLTLNASSTYTNWTFINAGTLLLGSSGGISQSAGINVGTGTVFNVSAKSGYAVASNQVLSGVGSVTGNVAVAAGGKIQPGTNNVAGALVFRNSLSLQPGSVFETRQYSASKSYAQAAVYGSVSVSNSILSITGFGSGIIIDNRGTNTVAGTFQGYPEGTAVNLGSTTRYITYAGGDGNDIEVRWISNTGGATDITMTNAVANGYLYGVGTNDPTVWIYWNTFDAGTNRVTWTNSLNLGTFSDAGPVSSTIGPLITDTVYYYRFYVSDGSDSAWSSPALRFTCGAPPVVNNSTGATANVGYAMLAGNLVTTGGAPTTVYTYWGGSDGGENNTGWDHVVTNGVLPAGLFSTTVSNVYYGQTYYYRTYATNMYGDCWADSSSPFVTLLAPFSENFDGVTAPALPPGWTTAGTVNWYTSITNKDTSPNAAFTPDMNYVTSNSLISPVFEFQSIMGPLSFRHSYTFEGTTTAYDGGVLEIKIGSNPWQDIIAAGGSWVSNAYTKTISTSYSNPLGGRSAWGGSSGGFITTAVNLPASAAGQQVQLRWVIGTDTSGSAAGWYVDTVSFAVGLGGVRQLVSAPATSVADSSAVLNGTLTCSGAVCNVYAYWNTVNGGTNAALWTNSIYMGTWTNVVSAGIAKQVTGLSPGTTYYFTLRGSNTCDDIWASNVLSFTTMAAPTQPEVENNGASDQTADGCTLSGLLTTGSVADAWICWGDEDAGVTSAGDWDHILSIGTVFAGAPFSAAVSGLETNKTYWYRCYVTNSAGSDWSDTVTSFSGLPAAGGGGSGSGYSMQITFTNFAGRGVLTNFPALVKLTTNNTDNYAGFLGTDGYELRFWTNEELTGTELNYEIESFDSTSNSFIWVQVPCLTNNCSIWASWGDPAKTSQQAYTTNGAVWDTNYVYVCHMGSVVDSTEYRNAAVTNTTVQTNGFIGYGRYFNGTGGNVIQLTNSPSLALSGNQLSVSVWGNMVNASAGRGIIGKGFVGDNVNDWAMEVRATTPTIRWYFRSAAQIETTGSTASGKWVHYDGTYNGASSVLYTNAAVAVSGSSGSNIGVCASPLRIGHTTLTSDANAYWYGVLDEVRISNIGRSSNWVWACWMNMGENHDSFMEYGEVAAGSGSPVQNTGPVSISNDSAVLNAVLNSSGTNYDVYAHWDVNDNGTSETWAYNAYVGSWTNVSSTNISYNVTNLFAGMTYYYTFSASNASTNVWAAPSWQFTTTGFNSNKVTLTVSSVHGGAIPGTTVTTNGAQLACSVINSPVELSGTTQYVCTGWAMTGNEPYSGTATNFVMTLTNNATLTWQWGLTNYWLDTLAGSGGSVDVADQWISAGSNIVITATADSGYGFLFWSGDTNSCTAAGNQITVPMTLARQITANFIEAPLVNNAGGAVDATEGGCTLQGVLSQGIFAGAWICWGNEDAGTTGTGSWDNVVSIGQVNQGESFSNVVSGLSSNVTYWYRCYVTNSAGSDWSDAATSFSCLPAGGGGGSSGGYSMQITFTNFADRGVLTNFPALVKLTTNNTDNYAGFLGTDGYELRFWTNAALTGAELNYEIETFNSSSNSFIWVQVPQLANNCSIWASWGDVENTNQEAYTTNGSAWSEGYAGVWHMSEPNAENSIVPGKNATSSGNVNASGLVNGCQSLDGNDTLTVSTNYSLSNLTLSCWFNARTTSDSWLLNKFADANNGWGPKYNGNVFIYEDIGGGDLSLYSTAAATGVWHYVVVVMQNPGAFNQKLYLDGGLKGSGTTHATGWNSYSANLYMGQRGNNASYYNGFMDEVRLSSVERSSNWVWACWMNMGENHGSFVEYGEVVAGSGSPVQNTGPVSISNDSAVLNAVLSPSATNYDVYAHWDMSDRGTNDTWTYNAYVGSWTNVSSTNIGYAATGLFAGTAYYYTFSASNGSGRVWAEPSWQFATTGAGGGNYVTLTVNSVYGGANPGATITTNGAELVCSVINSPVELSGTTQYVCTGWAMTGNEPYSGTATNFVMTLTNNATLTWQWKTNYWIELNVSGE